MFEDCPFVYSILQVKVMYFLVKTKNKLKYFVHAFNSLHIFAMLSFIFKHRQDSFDSMIFDFYLLFIWISISVSLNIKIFVPIINTALYISDKWLFND